MQIDNPFYLLGTEMEPLSCLCIGLKALARPRRNCRLGYVEYEGVLYKGRDT
jgi:hypothetical protein